MDFLNTPEKLNRRLNHLPMGRFGEAIEQAKAVLFREFPNIRLCQVCNVRVGMADSTGYVIQLLLTIRPTLLDTICWSMEV